MKTYVYIDGFNLYYGALKGTSYRWLDIEKFCRFMLPTHIKEGTLKACQFHNTLNDKNGDFAKPTEW